ncbi:hypothetical protein D3C72_1135300 [compost metagenome]
MALDLAQFDAKAAQLDLAVVAAHVCQRAVFQAPHQVAAAVQHFARQRRVSDEAFGRQFRPVQVAARNARAAHVQFARHAWRHRLAALVEHVQRQVRQRRADVVHAVDCILRGHQLVGDVHGRLGDAIHIHQRRGSVAEAVEPAPQPPGFERFATKDHVAQRTAAVAGQQFRHQVGKRGRGLVQHRDLFVDQQAGKLGRRARDVVRHDHQARAIQQRTPDFPYREIERVGVEQSPDVLRRKREVAFGGG